MNNLKNKVQLIGNLGNAPEVKVLENGKKLVRMNLATNETYKTAKGEKKTETQWHNIVAWNKIAEIAEKYFKKGMEVLIEGKLVSHTYTDKEGIKRYATEVHATDVMMLTKK